MDNDNNNTNPTPNELTTHIAKRITAMRLQKTWTREALAKRSGVNVHTLKHFERSGQIALERLIAIAYALDAEQEVLKLFKPRHRVNVDNWQVQVEPQRQRGRRNIDAGQDAVQEEAVAGWAE